MAIKIGSTDVSDIQVNLNGTLTPVNIVKIGGASTNIWQRQAAGGYLTFTSQQAGSTVTFRYASGTNVMYRRNGGTWTSCPSGTKTSSMAVGDTVQYKGIGVKTNSNYHFSMTGSLAGSGSVTSLTDGEGTSAEVTLTSNCYYYMFNDCSSLTSAPALPATTLAEYCYNDMFYGCTGLTSAPVLPATTLAEYCYDFMFYGCTGLTSAPVLNATTLAEYCYDGMFYGCTGLTSAPVLNATTLAEGCYAAMFNGCTGLTSAPVLNATTLRRACYFGMFNGCTGLTSAPALPATTLAEQCYYYMFNDCSSLKISANGGVGTKILDIPSGTTEPTDWNTNMFASTGGTFTGDPQVGVAYYCYT